MGVSSIKLILDTPVIIGLNQGRPAHVAVDDANGEIDSFISSYFIW